MKLPNSMLFGRGLLGRCLSFVFLAAIGSNVVFYTQASSRLSSQFGSHGIDASADSHLRVKYVAPHNANALALEASFKNTFRKISRSHEKFSALASASSVPAVERERARQQTGYVFDQIRFLNHSSLKAPPQT